jgi:hypothetical protein
MNMKCISISLESEYAAIVLQREGARTVFIVDGEIGGSSKVPMKLDSRLVRRGTSPTPYFETLGHGGLS